MASLVLLLVACDPIIDEQYLQNSTDVEGVELVAIQSTAGGNKITLDMVTPGVTGYWDYNLGTALTNKITFIYPIPGTSTFTFTGTLGAEFFTKTIDVQVDQLDNSLDQDWYDLVSEDTAAGKTWVFDGTGPNTDDLFWFMSAPDNPDGALGAWWNAGGTCCPPSDVNGKMHFDLNGAANFTHYEDVGASPENGSFVLDVANQQLIVANAPMLGYAAGNADGVYEIISLDEDQMVLYLNNNEANGTGWTFVFKAQ